MTAQVENPLSRILVDVPLYHEAAGARLLGIPGSLVEDRQYQADIAGVTLATGITQAGKLTYLCLHSMPDGASNLLAILPCRKQ